MEAKTDNLGENGTSQNVEITVFFASNNSKQNQNTPKRKQTISKTKQTASKTKQTLAKKEKGENDMFCPSCGKEMPDGAKFCGNCGNSVDNPATFVEVVEPPFVKWRTVSAVISVVFGALPFLLGVLSMLNGVYGNFTLLFVTGLFLLVAAVVSFATRESTNVVPAAAMPIFYLVAAVAGILAQSAQGHWAVIGAVMSVVVLVKIVLVNKAQEAKNSKENG